MTTRQYKNLKGLKKENLRDNMSTAEIVFNMLAEVSATNISQKEKPSTFSENQAVAKRGGSVAKVARKALEDETGETIITSKNATQLNDVVTEMIEGVANETDNNGDDESK